MSDIERVEPTIVDGIEFYVSKEGDKCGVSQIGLARLCGVTETPMRNLLTDLKKSSARSSEAQKLLDDLQGKDLYLALGSNQQAKIIESKVAARIVTYYAHEAKNQTEVAKYSLGKFASMGIDSWIKKVTGYAETGDIVSMLKTITNQLGEMQQEMSEMKVQLFETEGYRAARVVLPGLKEWMETVEAKDFREKALTPVCKEEELYTLNEWAELSQDGLVLSRSQKHSLANIVSSVYKLMELEPPPKVKRKAAQGNPMFDEYRDRKMADDDKIISEACIRGFKSVIKSPKDNDNYQNFEGNLALCATNRERPTN